MESLCLLDVNYAESLRHATGFLNFQNISICGVSASGIKGILLYVLLYCNLYTNINSKNICVIITEYFLYSVIFIIFSAF
jgi:hypothetical protein